VIDRLKRHYLLANSQFFFGVVIESLNVCELSYYLGCGIIFLELRYEMLGDNLKNLASATQENLK
jgi:hypothetical protein